ncbi:MAG TPA: sulfite exporter TauE/SafE family protein [Gaiellaceae bacterium]|nr:sulfite exporter TauE/SafE family protein [Gaiellaceae bacterium]
MIDVVIAIAVGIAAGIAAGLFGVGGGILFVPVLSLVFGLSQINAEATSLLAIIPTVAAGTWAQQRYGNVRWGAAVVMGVAAVVGVEAGVQIATALPESTLQRLFGLLMIAGAAQIAWRARGKSGSDSGARGR